MRRRNELINVAAPPARLFTAFGTVLFIDDRSGELRHGPIESSPANAFLVANQDANVPFCQGWLAYDSGSTYHPIGFEADGNGGVSRAESGTTADFRLLELIPLERGLIAFKAENVFLSAIPDGRIPLLARACSTWELFMASEDWCSGGSISDDNYYHHRFDAAAFDKKSIESYVVHPLTRARANRKPKAGKLLLLGHSKWPQGRIYYDLCKVLHQRGYLLDTLNPQINHGVFIHEIIPYYDLFVTALDTVSKLVDEYGISYDRIIAVSFNESDMAVLLQQKGAQAFGKLANYVVTTDFLYCTSLMRGIPRVPTIAQIGINYSEFRTDVSNRLATAGYIEAISQKIGDIELKRGQLAEAVACEAGLAFKIAGLSESQISFHDMPEFYRGVDTVLSSSITDSAGLSVMEAAAAGRLVIATPVGDFAIKAYQGAGIIAPIEPEKFKSFTAATLLFYRENPAAYNARCLAIQKTAEQFDWGHYIGKWVEVIDRACENSETNAEVTWSASAEAPSVQAPRSELVASVLDKPKVGVICDVNFLSSYICNEHHYLMLLMQRQYGFDIIDSEATDFQNSKAIDRLNTYDALLLYHGNLTFPVERVSSYKIVKIDDLVNYSDRFDKYLRRTVANCHMVVSPYAYTLRRHFDHDRIVWLPFSSGIEAYQAIAFNDNPMRKVLVSGSVAWDRPFRQYAASRKNDNIIMLSHPGYGKRYDGQSGEAVGQNYFRKMNKYLCCFCDAHKYRYLHPRNFEIASVGSLLLADKLIEKEMNQLGFVDHETCIFSDRHNFIEKVLWICDDKNRVEVDKIRRAGMELTWKKHLTKHRAKQLYDLVISAIAPNSAELVAVESTQQESVNSVQPASTHP